MPPLSPPAPQNPYRFLSQTLNCYDGLTFDLLRDADQILSAGRDFTDRTACLAAIQDAVTALTEEEPFTLHPTPEGQVLELTAPDGRTLAQSRPLAASSATALRAALAASAAEQEEYGIEFPPAMAGRTQTVPAFLGAAHTVSVDDYDFVRLSSSGTAGFEPFHSEGNGRFGFHFNDAQGSALLYSRGFATAAARNKRMQAVQAAGALAQRYEQREEGGRHFFILKARNGQEIARSRMFGSPHEVEAAIAGLLLEMPQHAEQFAGRVVARKGGKRHAGLAVASLTGLAGFELLRNVADRRHYFLFNGDDGRTLLFSQGYKGKESRDQAVRTLIRLGANPARYEAAEEGGEFFSIIRADNRQEIARSRAFESAAAAAAAMALLQTQLPASAAAFGVAPETLETVAGEHLTIRAERGNAPAAGVIAAPLLLGEAAAAAPAAITPAESILPVAAAAPIAAEAVRPAAIPPVTATVIPLTDGRSRGAGWGRLWPLAAGVAALPCLPWLLHARQQSQPNHPQTAPRVAASLSPVPAPVVTAVDSFIQSAGHPGHPMPTTKPALAKPVPAKKMIMPVGRVTRPHVKAAQMAQRIPTAAITPPIPERHELTSHSQRTYHRPNFAYLHGPGS